MPRKMMARVTRRRIHPDLTDRDWGLLAEILDGGGFCMVRAHNGHLQEVRGLTKDDSRFIEEMLSANGYHLARTHERHLVELRRVTPPVEDEETGRFTDGEMEIALLEM